MNIDQMKKILDDAPDGATHYCHEYLIANDDGWKWWDECAWRFVKETSVSWATTRAGLHNLSDLRTIVNQHEEIERLREQVPQWISVDDGLPEKCKHNDLSVSVLVYNEYDKCKYTAVYDYLDKNWFCFHSHGILHYEITHWMPLPHPSKEKGDE